MIEKEQIDHKILNAVPCQVLHETTTMPPQGETGAPSFWSVDKSRLKTLLEGAICTNLPRKIALLLLWRG
jgi:hypothetical protein